MTDTALEATASSSCKNVFVLFVLFQATEMQEPLFDDMFRVETEQRDAVVDHNNQLSIYNFILMDCFDDRQQLLYEYVFF